jgi:signal transduction histidine kinase
MKDSFAGTAQPILRWNTFSIGQFVQEVCQAFQPRLTRQGIRTEIDVPAEALLLADRELLRQALVNLIDNALEAMPDGGELVITCVAGHGGLELEVADSGPGLADDVRAHVFKPYFTTRDNAAGLGLNLVQRVAALHGGTVSVLNCPEGGAAFTLHIPRRVMAAAA